MCNLSGKLGVALLLAALCLGGRTAHAQAAPVTYWTPGWPLGFGGNMAGGQSADRYGNFPGFDGGDGRGGGFSYQRYNFPNGWFVGGGGGRVGSGLNGLTQDVSFGDSSSFYSQGLYSRGLYSQGVQFGYNFQTAGGLPLTVYAGFDTLKYSPGIGSPFPPFDSLASTQPGYSAHAGIEFQPTSNVSLAVGFGYTQQPDMNSLALPGTSPFAINGRR